MSHHPGKKSEASRQPARIVPAIPLPHSRATQRKPAASSKPLQRALTPDTSEESSSSSIHNGTRDDAIETQPNSIAQEPMTPDSLPSSVVKRNTEIGGLGLGVDGANAEWEKQNTNSRARDKDNHGKTLSTNGILNPNANIHGPGQLDHFDSDANGNPGSRQDPELNMVEGTGSAENGHSREGSRDFVPFTVPTELPPPFYPQQTTSTPTSSNPTTMNPPSGMHHPRPIPNMIFGGRADSSSSSPAQLDRPVAPYVNFHATETITTPTLYPPNLLNGSFSPPGLPNPHALPVLLHGFNPEANAFFAAGDMHSRSQSQASDLQSPGRVPHHVSSVSVTNGLGRTMSGAAARSLTEYLSHQFGSPDFADCTIEVSDFHATSPPAVVSVHGIIVARSPKLRSLMAQETGSATRGIKTVRIQLNNKFQRTDEFVQVLRFLYGIPLSYRNMLAPKPMQQALAFAAVGFYLQLPEITVYGLEYATGWLSWDTAETALAFALDGGLTQAWKLDSSSREPQSQPTFGEVSGQFLQTVLDWLAGNFPVDFKLSTSANQLSEIPRLPAAIENRPSVSDPRLSRIQFGQVPLGDSSRVASATTSLSSILFSLPFPALKYLLEHPLHHGRQPRIAEITHAIVEERETRRAKALKTKRFLPGATENMREEMLWEERVVPKPNEHHLQKFMLVHSKIGGESNGTAHNS